MRQLLLIILFLLAQAGAHAHGLMHLPDQDHDDDPLCTLCLAYAPLAAGMASAPLPALPPRADRFRAATTATAPNPCFDLGYRSRAPPLG